MTVLSHSPTIDLGIKTYLSCNPSEAQKSRMILWSFSLIGLGIAVLRGPHTVTGFSIMMLIFLSTVGLLDYYLLKQFRPGQLVIKLTPDGIESPLLPSSIQSILWEEIKGASIEAVHDQPCLIVQLDIVRSTSGVKGFFDRRISGKHVISLAGLDIRAQDELAQGITQGLQSHPQAIVQDITNSVRETRAFMETIREMAPTPWVTVFLVVTNVIVWLAILASGGKLLGTSSGVLFDWGASATSAVQNGEGWRLLSSIFIHGSIFHLVINMAALISGGLIVERIYGHRLFALIYFGSGLIGSSMSLHFASQAGVAVGASGAIFGVLGALFVAVIQHRKRLPKTFTKQIVTSLSFFITYSLIQSLLKSNIDTAAHIGGLIAGCVIGTVLPERLASGKFEQQRLQRGVVTSILALSLTYSLVQMAPPAKVDVERSIIGSQLLADGMNKFAELLADLEQEEKDVAAGKRTARESDERSRSVFAPRMAEVLKALKAGYLSPDDHRRPVLLASIRMAELMEESLAMQSVFISGSELPLAVDPARAATLKKEMVDVMTQLRPQK